MGTCTRSINGYARRVIAVVGAPLCRYILLSLCLCIGGFEPLLASSSAKTNIPRYSFNPKEGDLTAQGGLSIAGYNDVTGRVVGYGSRLSYYVSDHFGVFIGIDLPLTTGTLDIDDVDYRVRLVPSKLGVLAALPLTTRVSLTFDGGVGSTLVLGSGLSPALLPQIETGATLSYDTGVWRFFSEVSASYSKGTVKEKDVDLGRKTFAIGLGIKI